MLYIQAFQKHISDVYASKNFKETAKAAQPFFDTIRDFVFGRPTTLENAVCFNLFSTITMRLTRVCIPNAPVECVYFSN